MNFAILIQARLGSSRFPKKIIKDIDGKTVIEYMIDRLLKVFRKKNIIINTTNSVKDNKLVKIAKRNKLLYFRGSENNVLDRYLKCSKKFNVKNIIHLTSDCPLVDVDLLIRMKRIFKKKKKLDYFANTYPPELSNFPDGSDIEIYKQKSLIKLSKMSDKKEDKEHVTNFFWKNPNTFNVQILKSNKNLSLFKYSLDYENELFLIRKIIKISKKKKIKLNYRNIVKIIKTTPSLKRISNQSLLKFKKNRKDLYN